MPSASRFDLEIDRRDSWSTKWNRYGDRDVLPFWVADMDFRAPDCVLDAVRTRLDHGVLGYTQIPAPLTEAFRAWLQRGYGWQVPKEWLVWLPGVVTGLNLSAMAAATPQGSVLIPTPVYYPFLAVPNNAQQQPIHVGMQRSGERWVIDFDAMGKAVKPHTRLIMISNPQNPTGRAYSRAELTELAAFAERHDLIICSDEIHCSLILDDKTVHTPIASLSEVVAKRTITLFAATKTYNIPGLSCAVAVIPDAKLRMRFKAARRDLVPGIGPLAFAASAAAFNDQSDWVPSLVAYLRGNHARLAEVAGLRMTPVEATYLAWIDVSDLGLDDPAAYFEQHGLGLSDGRPFAGPGFVRFNFGCPRAQLERGLERLEKALQVRGEHAQGR
ncbi:MAG: PatB family C-S lyase [Gammaproteobacteria bacterium]|nr:PatB family C-S lyase [Gammaproteobacteria bacterium]